MSVVEVACRPLSANDFELPSQIKTLMSTNQLLLLDPIAAI
jgi:hypothetical protein